MPWHRGHCRWSLIATRSGRSLQGDLSLGAQQPLGLSCRNLGAAQLPPQTSAEDLLLGFGTVSAFQDQQLVRTAVRKPIKDRTCTRGEPGAWCPLARGEKCHPPPVSCCDGKPALASTAQLILNPEHRLGNFICFFILAGGLQDLFILKRCQPDAQHGAWR